MTLKDGSTREVPVIATFDGASLSAWDFAEKPS